MKYLLLALSAVSLTACQNSDTETPDTGAKAGYVAGYQLTCGLPWTAGNRLVVDKEFARDFLDGAIICAREHPEQARKVLGLDNRAQTLPAREPDEPPDVAPEEMDEPEPVVQEASEQKQPSAPSSRRASTARVPAKTVKAPAKPSAAPPKAAKAPVKAAKAPAQTAKAPAKSAEAPATATGAPVETRAIAKTVKPAVKSVAAPPPKPEMPAPSVEDTRGRQDRNKKQRSDYDLFLGRE